MRGDIITRPITKEYAQGYEAIDWGHPKPKGIDALCKHLVDMAKPGTESQSGQVALSFRLPSQTEQQIKDTK